MGLKKSTAKLDDYFERLEQNKAAKITPEHVEKVLEKLRAKERDLLYDLETAHKVDKAERLRSKLNVVREQLRRGEWLLEEIRSDA
jgi:predicted ribosome quality control (RQC) complex YloA/Tae2 family protein